MQNQEPVHMEFHVSRQARDRYQFDDSLFSLSGNVLFANFHASRVFADKMNESRDLVTFPEQAVKAGQINAMGLIDEILHHVIDLYRQQRNPDTVRQALAWLNDSLGPEEVDAALYRFADDFPPVAVYQRDLSAEAYMTGESAGIPNRQILLEEMLALWLANTNPAFGPFKELYDDATLTRDTVYSQITSGLYEFFEKQPAFGPQEQNLVDLLRSPAIAVPHSLSGQLEYIRERWGPMMGQYLYRLLSSLDLIQEEEKAIFAGPGPSLVYDFDELEFEPERFSPDRDWMPNLVLMAKNIYVWLHQLAQKYERPINRLDEIPDEELDMLAQWGFSGLWLIGLWERSSASRRVKQMCGNPEAVASAYSLYDYQIAADLGGEQAYLALQDRAWQRGIRMASDMVPNHVGIYSKWLIEHPDWFVSLDHSPFPAYSFNGPDLSEDDRVGIYLEDHYYDRSDAAVVFKRVDRLSGSEKYIYHGNDGTRMPWNDTAQLNYLNSEVREAVIQTILHVARKFPVIRFDAAMTLAKKHYQRLWYPEPGTGGAIPTRAEYGLTKADFDAAMPLEFWREVVDRVAAEAPDTLLLAEAFWLLEGYFVRTLGMHRVYNSAFMNMLRDEDNGKYRLVIKNTLEFDPEILKRFVSFMNNPDEDTAIEQFGKGDKYFGICTMMATLPGLPMFGHGQIEGYAEKYGMEYRRAYWDEQPDHYLAERHKREIFPLLHQRHVFAKVEHFLLYDFFTAQGSTNEDVFAYSNQAEDERALVLYHNKFATAKGWIKNSAAFSVKPDDGGDRMLVQKSLGEGLGLHNDGDYYAIFQDDLSGLEYIRSSKELWENGLYAELEAYECHVFAGWREVQDNEWHQYAHLADYLSGRGVPSVEEALQEVFLQPIHHPFKELVNAGALRWLMENRVVDPKEATNPELLADFSERVLLLLREIIEFTESPEDATAIAEEIGYKLQASLELRILADRFPLGSSENAQAANALVQNHMGDDTMAWGCLNTWLFTHALGKVIEEKDFAQQSRSLMDEWLLSKLVTRSFLDLGLEEKAAWQSAAIVNILINHQGWYKIEAPEEQRTYQILVSWLRDSEVQDLLQVNRYRGLLWFNHEAFGQLLDWMLTLAAVEISAEPEFAPVEVVRQLAACYQVVGKLQEAETMSEFQVVKLMEATKGA